MIKLKKNKYFNEIEKIYKEMSPHLKERLKEFKNIWENGSNKDIHLELSFCILTPIERPTRDVSCMIHSTLLYQN